MSSYRLVEGGAIDRSTSLGFSFDGKRFRGHAGDTLASALLANGVTLVGRSFKYHRPRGVLTAGSTEPNALVELHDGDRREPNTRATMIELHDGLVATSQNRWPSLAFDVGAVNQLAAPLIGAGFYYKTFMWPARFWEMLYEPVIRRAAGLGRASGLPDPDHYQKAFAHCDVLVIGAGPTGLMAALSAARSGARTILVDEQPTAGGSLLNEREVIDGLPGAVWAANIAAELASLPGIRILQRTTAFGWYDGNLFGAVERVGDHGSALAAGAPRQRLWRIIARTAVLAAGAEERPLVFADNDRPGVMMASAVRAYANRFGVAAGTSVLVFTNNDSGYRTARDLASAGVRVAAVVDSRPGPAGVDVGEARVVTGAMVTAVHGRRSVTSVDIVRDGRRESIACDAVAMSGGFNPVISLACHRGARPVWDERLACFLPPPGGPELLVAGAARGEMTLPGCFADGAARGAEAAAAAGFASVPAPTPRVADESYRIEPLWLVAGDRGKAFVDFQNDVTTADVALAAREGYVDVEQTKRYTTLGMATDQGKLSNLNGIALLAAATGRSIPEIGTTTYRPFYTPVSFGALAGSSTGKHFQPTRRSPLHSWCAEQGAVFVEAGLWLRPSWFARDGERDWFKAMLREVSAVRTRVGVCDVSTLGKIEVAGQDALTFLDRLYCNPLAKLPVGKARYGVMLREDGMVFDDGTVSRLEERRFFLTTTTANAGAVLSHMEFCHQAVWPELDVQFASVSDQWAQLAIAGPKARATLRGIIDGTILGGDGFPPLAVAETTVCGGLPARLFRLSFSGEHAYELAVPADVGDAVIRAIMRTGAPFGIVPYGLEALSAMRIEKGHVAGAELNGTTTPADLGLGRMMSRTKDYIGKALSDREGLISPDREVLTGIRPRDPTLRIRAGAHILAVDSAARLENDQGHITSAAYSPTLSTWIGLALVRRGASRHGEAVRVFDGIRGSTVLAELCDPVHLDPGNERLHA